MSEDEMHHAQVFLAMDSTLLHSIFDQPEAQSVVAQCDRELVAH
jgi:hypothetical protein